MRPALKTVCETGVRKPCDRSIVTPTVVVSCETVVRTRTYKLFAKTTVSVAIHFRSLAIEVFKVQPDYSCIVEIGRKVVRGVGSRPAHVNDRISYFGRELVDMLRIPRLVVWKTAPASKSARLSA